MVRSLYCTPRSRSISRDLSLSPVLDVSLSTGRSWPQILCESSLLLFPSSSDFAAAGSFFLTGGSLWPPKFAQPVAPRQVASTTAVQGQRLRQRLRRRILTSPRMISTPQEGIIATEFPKSAPQRPVQLNQGGRKGREKRSNPPISWSIRFRVPPPRCAFPRAPFAFYNDGGRSFPISFSNLCLSCFSI